MQAASRPGRDAAAARTANRRTVPCDRGARKSPGAGKALIYLFGGEVVGWRPAIKSQVAFYFAVWQPGIEMMTANDARSASDFPCHGNATRASCAPFHETVTSEARRSDAVIARDESINIGSRFNI